MRVRITKKVYQHRKQCKHCQKIFYAHNSNKKYCTYECAGLAQSDTRHDMQPTDPTPQEIADICRKIKSGELVIHSSPEHEGAVRRGNLRPNWVLTKKLR